MKKLHFIFLLSFALLLCACSGGDANTEDTKAQTTVIEETETEPETETEIETEPETEAETEPETEPETEAATEAWTEAPAPETQPVYVPPAPPQMDLTVGGYNVYDPYNTRGLSTERRGYGFGIAPAGQRPGTSVSNQQYFDSLAGVDALAIDLKSSENVIYLTFDCGYEYNNNTAKILDILAAKDVPAAFFCTMQFLRDCPQTAMRMINEGHILGNHSNTHPVFPDLTREQMAMELYAVDAHLQSYFGYKSEYFRFPTGAYSENALELCTSVGYKNVFWSVAYDDWDTSKQKGYDYGFNTVTGRLHPGAVILLHAVSNDNVAILADFIDYARSLGYTFVSLDSYAW